MASLEQKMAIKARFKTYTLTMPVAKKGEGVPETYDILALHDKILEDLLKYLTGPNFHTYMRKVNAKKVLKVT
jgi:hypothetical protein